MNPFIDLDNRLMEYLKLYLEKGIIQSLEVKHSLYGSPTEVFVKLVVPIERIQFKFDVPAIDQDELSKQAYERAKGVIK